MDPIASRTMDELKASPQGSGSPGTPTTPCDRAAAKRAEQRRIEQERRRREAVSFLFFFFLLNDLEFVLTFFSFTNRQMAGQIDMNMQSDLMAAFEESLEKERK